MPKVYKSMVEPIKTDILSRVQPVSWKEGGTKFLVFGVSKTGKTRFACSFPKPMLLIGTEDGTRSVADIKNLDFILLQSINDFTDLLEVLPNKYRSIGLDTAGGLQDLILQDILKLQRMPLQKSYNFASREHWQTCTAHFKEHMRRLFDFAENGTNIVVIAHERDFHDREAPTPDIVFPSIGAALSPAPAGWLHAECDFVCQTFRRQKLASTTIKIEGKQREVQKPSDEVEFCLRIGPHPVYMTGIRQPGKHKIPSVIEDPTFDKLFPLIRGS